MEGHMAPAEDAAVPPSLIRADGSRFDRELAEIEGLLSALGNDARLAFRDRNATEISQHAAKRILVVAGPGAGKSTLFLARIKHWLPLRTDTRIYVSSFVRKLVKDLQMDISGSHGLARADRDRVAVTTLHTLARSLLSRNGGTIEQPLGRDVQVISADWERMVWADVLAFNPQLNAQTFSQPCMAHQFHTEEFDPTEDWQQSIATYLRLGRFYNAVGFPDMISLARRAVEENPALNDNTHWIIDEFQDFNTAEVNLIRSLTHCAEGVLLAGDDEQALYEQMKATLPAIIISFYDDAAFANAMLPYCSRCSYYVCLAASAFITKHRSATAIPKIYLPLRLDEAAAKVRVVGTAVPNSAVDYIADFVEQHRAELDTHKAQMETGSETDPYLLILTPGKDLAFYKLGGAADRLRSLVAGWSNVGNRPSSDYWRTATYASAGWDDANNFALRKVLYYEDVPAATVHTLLATALASNRPLVSVLDSTYDLLRSKAASIATICGSADQPAEQKATAIAAVIRIADPGRLARDLKAHPLDLSWAVNGDEADEVIETAGAMAPVELLSLVGSKGLSAHHVIVVGCDDLNLKRVSRLTFFVALTRARTSLHLITSLKAGGSSKTHDFILELPEVCCEYVAKTRRGLEVLSGTEAFVRTLGRWSYGARGQSRPSRVAGERRGWEGHYGRR